MGHKSKDKTSSNSTTVATPQVPSWISGPYSNYTGQINTMLGQTATSTPASALQQQAWTSAGALGPNQQQSQTADATRALLGYTPTNVEAGQLATTDLSAYMNPYLSNVADTTMQGLERARASAISGGQGSATLSGAYGGSRHGVADAETNRGYLDTTAATLANLYAGGFQNAQGAALSDIGNRLNADQFNVNSGLNGANFRLGAANQLGAIGAAQGDDARANAATQAALGEQQRGVAQENDPQQAQMNYLQQLGQLLGLVPTSTFTGQNVNQRGSSTTKSSGSGLSIGWGPNGFQFGFG